MSLSDYQIALANFNAAMNADPIQRAINDGSRAWGDIMYDEDISNSSSANHENIEQFIARMNLATNTPIEKSHPFRSWNSSSFQRPPRHNFQSRHTPIVAKQQIPTQVKQQIPSQVKQQIPSKAKQQKRPRNSFAALSEEDSE